MEVNGTVLVIVGVLLVALLLFIITKNRKDRKHFESQLKQDYKKPKKVRAR
jgi:LPXTG-motif cell wall-anchored protein